MTEQTLKLDIPLLLPEIADSRDSCVTQLERALMNRKGIVHAHVQHDSEPAQLCLHYDPNLVSLAAVHRLAQQVGADFSRRYRHETIPVIGMDVADAAGPLADDLRHLPGMIHATVNYAAGLAFVAYDSQQLNRETIVKAIRQQGYQVAKPSGRIQSKPFVDQLREYRHPILIGLSGFFLLAGWAGETFFSLPGDVALAFYLLAYLAGGYDLATHAIPGIFRGVFDTDILMLAAAVGAATLGAWAEGAFLLFLFGLGHAGEQYALNRARYAVSALGNLMPETAHVKLGEQFVEKKVETLVVGDIVLVRPGDRIPADGTIVHGRGAIDQSAITGESVPVTRGAGDELFAGTINQDSALEVRVTRRAQDNTLSRIMQIVAEAQQQQSPSHRFAQRFTAVFVPLILILVAVVALLPPLMGWVALEESFYRAMLLLVAASPCALAIGTPAAVLAGIAQAARNGVLIKGGVHLENLGEIKVMAFDKTGTLTSGEFRVTDIITMNGVGEKELLRLAAAAEGKSNHPLALAVVNEAKDQGLDLPPAGEMVNFSGQGLRCQVNGQSVSIGSLAFFQEDNGHRPDEHLVQLVANLEQQGKTTMIASCDGRLLGLLALTDQPRPGVKQTLQALLNLGVRKLVMLTGDNQVVAAEIGRQIGVTDIRPNLLPREKLVAIDALRRQYGPVAMTGDGVNDAPALAAATVGIAMGGAGTDVALETADVALMANDLSKLPFAVGLSRASRAVIRQNLAIALAVILLLILVAFTGSIQLSGAVVLHEGSTILVVLNALRLLRYHEKTPETLQVSEVS